MDDRPVAVVGSLNIDLVVYTERMPEAGETVSGSGMLLNAGGKGANQAVACARSGARTAMLGRVGDDQFAETVLDALRDEHIQLEHVHQVKACATGMAAVTVETITGDNRIVCLAGANGTYTSLSAAERSAVESASFLVLQLEVPLELVVESAHVAARAGVRVVLTPAPAPASLLPDHLYSQISYLVPNAIEAAVLAQCPVSSVDDAHKAGQILLSKGIRAAVIITLGELGVVLAARDGQISHFKAQSVQPVDTTAAGDSFLGAFVAALSRGKSLVEAIDLGQKVAAVTITRPGALSSIPRLEELAT